MTLGRHCAAAFAVVLTLCGAGVQAAAQEIEADAVEDIVVTARRTQTPIWEVSRGDRSLILVGNIRALPRDLAWSPAGLEAATVRADRILYPPEARVSGTDILRLIWRSRSLARAPEGTTSADHLPPEVQARLEAVMGGDADAEWRRRSFLLLSNDLLTDKAGLRRGGRDAEDAVRGAARRAKVKGEAVGFVRGDEIIDTLLTQPPSAYAPCIAASVAAAEAGPDSFARRAEDWRGLRVADVIANPLDVALGRCWPWGDPEIGPQLSRQWLTALSGALDQPGVTLAVAPLRLLAEPDGVLDGLEAQGFEIEGPDWRADQDR